MSCWILSSPRTGGNYLSMILNESGMFENQPGEDHAFDEWLSLHYHNNAKDFLQSPPKFLNLHHMQFARCFQKNDAFIKSILEGTKYIVLKRRDFLAQVASYYIAKTTNTWRIYGEDALDSYKDTRVPMDDDLMLECHKHMSLQKYAWDEFEGDVLKMYYEDLLDCPEIEIERLFSFLAVPQPTTPFISKANDKYKRTHRPETNAVKNRLAKLLSGRYL